MAFPGTGLIWMNGKFVEWNQAQIHIASHVIHYGSGVFEGARCYDTRQGSACFRLDAHVRRLLDSAKIYRMESPYNQQQIADAVVELIRRNGFKACYIRPLIYRGYDSLGVNPFPCPVDVAVMLWEWGAYFTKDAIEEGLDVKISTWARNAPNTMPSMAKSVANYANSQLIKMEAILEGYAEGIALDTGGNLSEGSGQNVFIVRDGTIQTPPLASSVLAGITRDSVMTLARDLGFPVIETVLPREAIAIAEGEAVHRRQRRPGLQGPDQFTERDVPFAPYDHVSAPGGILVDLHRQARIVTADDDGRRGPQLADECRHPLRRAALERHHRQADHVGLKALDQPLDRRAHAAVHQDQIGDRHLMVRVDVAGQRSQGAVRHARRDHRRVLERIRHGEQEDPHRLPG